MTDAAQRLSAALADHYAIERELGQGGMATVYLAHDVRHDRKVALKVLRPELAAVIGAERFLKEIKVTANLQHPHVLGLIDSGEADRLLYYVMPFVEGESLRDRLTREKQLPVDDAVRITREVASALDYAHRHHVIHRDIKPENILLHEGQALVADFGIALAVSAAGGTRMTETGMSLGTPHYMSPEQAMGEREITARSDVYALGCVLYEMLVGEPPFTGPTAQAIVAKVVTETPRPLVPQRHTIPPHVEAAALQALEKLPADRFGTAALFADALANASFATAAPASGRATPASLARRTPGLPAVALLGFGALALGVAGAKLVWRERAPTTTTRLMLEFPASQQPRLPTFNRPILAQLPDGSGFLYSGPGANTRTQLWIRRWDRLEATRLLQTVDDGCCAVFSPHGDSLAYLTPPHLLRVVPLTGGLSTTVADSGLTPVTDFGGGVDWGSDGMLYASGLDGLIRISPRGGKAELVGALDAGRGDLRYLWPAVLPGARGALVTVVPTADPTNPERASIGVVNFQTGKVDVILQGTRAIFAPTGHVIVAKPNGVLWAAAFDRRSLVLTGSARELTDTIAIGVGGFGDFSLSPGGALAYTKGVVQSYQAVWVSRNGESRPVAADVSDYGLDMPALSPDGRRLAISMSGPDGKSSLWVKPLDGGPKVRLTFDGSYNGRAAWRPGSGAISFTSDREQAGVPTRLFEVAADGSGRLTRPELHDRRAIGAHTWSPDGKWLVFRTDDQEAGNGDIMGIRPGVDTVPRALVATPAEELSPAVSFDGRWIAYSSNETGRREVFVRPFPQTGDARYQISSSGGTNPTWNRNGRELFYLDAEGNMVAVPVIAGATFQTSQPIVLFRAAPYESNPWGRMYDVAPDGQRFVMIRGETDAAVHVVIVFNFLAELQQLMARP